MTLLKCKLRGSVDNVKKLIDAGTDVTIRGSSVICIYSNIYAR